jgi:hypothetical protein
MSILWALACGVTRVGLILCSQETFIIPKRASNTRIPLILMPNGSRPRHFRLLPVRIYFTIVCVFLLKLDCTHNTSPFSVIVGGLAACFNCCVICTPNPSRGYQCFALLYLFACLSQGLTFLFVQSDACLNNPIFNLELDNVTVLGVSCNLSWGANTSIAATVLWFVSACMMCCMGFKESKSSAAGGDSADVDEEPAEEAPEEAVEDAAKE